MMSLPINTVEEMANWRRHLHAHPEFGFAETQTSTFVAKILRGFGITDVAEGVGGTGVVATLDRGGDGLTVGLRADMDALKINEQSELGYSSRHPGLMHACGHDGHTAMLLGAAKLLSERPDFRGCVRFIFQPAEEWGSGALAMLEDGLLKRFPVDEIYGLHNWPGLGVGKFATRVGSLMSAEDNFEITFTGQGGHASRPHKIQEALVAGCDAVMALQTIVSRRIDPADTAVVSVTEFITDGTRNVLPGQARIRGDVRSFRASTSALIEREMRRIAEGVGVTYNCRADVVYTREFVPLVNQAEQTKIAVAAAERVFGVDAVDDRYPPATASEDFARFLEHVPGCFAFIGNGEDSKPLHNPEFDFNDRALASGAAYLAELAVLRSERASSKASSQILTSAD